MPEWLTKHWVETLLGLIIVGIYKRLTHIVSLKFREQDAIKLGIQALLRDRIIQSYNQYQEKEFCPIYAMENVTEMYEQYHALGGNGTVTELVERLRSMPTEIKEGRNIVC